MVQLRFKPPLTFFITQTSSQAKQIPTSIPVVSVERPQPLQSIASVLVLAHPVIPHPPQGEVQVVTVLVHRADVVKLVGTLTLVVSEGVRYVAHDAAVEADTRSYEGAGVFHLPNELVAG